VFAGKGQRWLCVLALLLAAHASMRGRPTEQQQRRRYRTHPFAALPRVPEGTTAALTSAKAILPVEDDFLTSHPRLAPGEAAEPTLLSCEDTRRARRGLAAHVSLPLYLSLRTLLL
jgi:hypothetical protein